MSDYAEGSAISDDYAVNRLFELAREGRQDDSEYALLDALVQARLRQAYAPDDDTNQRVRVAG